jgi:uncharacterized membrane protein YeaQ/YmgE (transglycosylase-associated protein family)
MSDAAAKNLVRVCSSRPNPALDDRYQAPGAEHPWITGKGHEGFRLRSYYGHRGRHHRAIVGGLIMQPIGFTGSGGMIYTIIVVVIGAVIRSWLSG